MTDKEDTSFCTMCVRENSRILDDMLLSKIERYCSIIREKPIYTNADKIKILTDLNRELEEELKEAYVYIQELEEALDKVTVHLTGGCACYCHHYNVVCPLCE